MNSLMAMMVAHGNSAGVATPYVQRVQYATTVRATSHDVVFPSTPTNGNSLFIFLFADTTTINTPGGWNLELNNTVGTTRTIIFDKTAGASEPTTVTITTNACILVAVAFEFAGGSSLDDSGNVTIDEGTAGNTIGDAVTSGAGKVFIDACYRDVANATEGPFSFSNSFSQIGYSQAPADGVSVNPIEIVIGYRETTTSGTYNSVVTATTTDAGITAPGIIMATV